MADEAAIEQVEAWLAEEELEDWLSDLHIPDEVITNLTEEQGVSSIAILVTMDEPFLKEIVSNMRKPGGEAAGGFAVTAIAERTLLQARLYVFHLNRIQRPFDRDTATLVRIQDLWNARQRSNKAAIDETTPLKDMDLPDKFLKVEDARLFLEKLDTALENLTGLNGAPLLYVVRKEVELPEDTWEGKDPGYGEPTFEAELIRRTTHDNAEYRVDNKIVFKILQHLTQGGPGWNWVSKFLRSKNGRGAYLALQANYFGSDYVAKVVSDADQTVSTIYYDGKARNFTWDKFTERLNQAFTDLQDNGETLTERKKIRTLLTAVRDPALATAVELVDSQPENYSTFEKAKSYIKRRINANASRIPHTRTVAAANSGRGGGRGGRGGRGGPGRGRGGRGGRGRRHSAQAFDPANPAQTLDSAVWRSLTDAQKAAVRKAREDAKAERKRKAAALDVQPEDNTQEQGVGGQMSRRRTD